jgi:hypothetical protein
MTEISATPWPIMAPWKRRIGAFPAARLPIILPSEKRSARARTTWPAFGIKIPDGEGALKDLGRCLRLSTLDL